MAALGADTFTLLPVHINETTKAIEPNPSFNPSTIPSLQSEITDLNSLHRSLLEFNHAIPPPPVPVQPARSVAINKLREQGNANFRKQNYNEALKHYTQAVQMALDRPHWEPSQLVRDELAVLYSNRSQCYVAMRKWPEGLGDAEMSIQCRQAGNTKAWYRSALCLKEMGDLVRARDQADTALEWEGVPVQGPPGQEQNKSGAGEAELKALLRDINTEIGLKEKAGLL